MIMIHPTIETLRRLRLTGMAKALGEQQGLPDCDASASTSAGDAG